MADEVKLTLEQARRAEFAVMAADRMDLAPYGFEHMGRSHGEKHGYDADAFYNAQTRELLIINHGANALYGADKEAVFHGGGKHLAIAQQFLNDTLDKLPQTPVDIILAGHSLGGVLADAQGVSLLRKKPELPFTIVNFDSIGGGRYAKELIAEEIAAINQHTIAYHGDAISRDFEVFHTFSLLKEKLPTFTTHIFYDKGVDPLANPAAGATLSQFDIHHHIGNFVAPVFHQVRASLESAGLPSR